jgi:hypothetical protein
MDGICSSHRTHGDKKPPPSTLSKDQLRAIQAEFLSESENTGYAKFCHRYYTILREMYNVAGEEMQEQYIQYRTMGRSAFNALHSKKYSGFRSEIE